MLPYLKLSSQRERLAQEAKALRAFAGNGAVLLLDANASSLLVERAEPGTTLVAMSDAESIPIAAGVAARLWSAPASATFPTIATWIADLDRLRDHFALANEAIEVAKSLVSTSTENVLLHGDLHHENIVLSQRGWLAIDPVGILGERAADIAQMVINPSCALRDAGDLAALLDARLRHWSEEANLDPERLRAWTFVRAVLGVVWAAEDRVTIPSEWLRCAEILHGFTRLPSFEGP